MCHHQSVQRIILLASIAACLVWAAESRGQTLLERLEKRLQETSDSGANVSGDATPASGSIGIVVADQAEANGMRIIEVRKGSPADRAGFRVDDVVTAINGKQVRSVEDVANSMRSAPKGGTLKVDVLRDGDPKQMVVAIAAAPRPSSAAPQVPVVERPALGITVAPVTDDLRTKYGFPVRRGAVISAIRPGGSAVRYGLPVGGVIIAIDGRKVDMPQDLIDIVRRLDVGQEVELTYYDGAELQHKKVRLAPELEPFAPAPDQPRSPPPPPAPRLREPPAAELPAPRPSEEPRERPSTADRVTRPGIFEELAALRAEVTALKEQVAQLTKRLDALTPVPAEPPAEPAAKPANEPPAKPAAEPATEPKPPQP